MATLPTKEPESVVVAAGVAVIAVISYVIYNYVNKKAGQTTQKDDGAYANERKHAEEDTPSDEDQEDATRPSVSANQSTLGTFARLEDVNSAGEGTVVLSRYTGTAGVSIHGVHFTQDGLEPYFDFIAKEMPADWQQLARNLGLQVQVVNQQHSSDGWMRCQQVLNTWRKTNGRRATIDKLIQAVKETGRQDVVDKMEDEFD